MYSGGHFNCSVSPWRVPPHLPRLLAARSGRPASAPARLPLSAATRHSPAASPPRAHGDGGDSWRPPYVYTCGCRGLSPGLLLRLDHRGWSAPLPQLSAPDRGLPRASRLVTRHRLLPAISSSSTTLGRRWAFAGAPVLAASSSLRDITRRPEPLSPTAQRPRRVRRSGRVVGPGGGRGARGVGGCCGAHRGTERRRGTLRGAGWPPHSCRLSGSANSNVSVRRPNASVDGRRERIARP